MSTSQLFQPIKLGTLDLQHRVVHAPLTRYKATKKGHVQLMPMVRNYYSQRSSTPGTLLFSEATLIHEKAGGYDKVPGIWSDEQIEAWKQVTEAVHANKSFIFSQLWALGRVAEPQTLRESNPPLPFIAPSPTLPPGADHDELPRAYTIDEIHEVVQLYAQAAKNAVFKAGFDGVEIHGANGYLFDQFLQDVTNLRTDEYGGSIENRSRFCLEVVDAVVEAVGAERVGIRLSPWSPFQGMGMKDPIPQFAHFVSSVKMKHPKLAYLHVIEPRIDGNKDRTSAMQSYESNDFIRAIWSPKPYISAGGYDREKGIATADATGSLITYGRHFISNPDLPIRLKNSIPLNQYNRKTFYIDGESAEGAVGYTDYPFAENNRFIPVPSL
ncbi:hypothetical protein AX17_003828 [Amanita inopinata Kibby_2008]|nr:hypothetical protein AX17_003828 [Amanita inopinata Kibby_2008]